MKRVGSGESAKEGGKWVAHSSGSAVTQQVLAGWLCEANGMK